MWAGSMAVYWRQGDPSAVVAPDLFVVLEVTKGDRQSYRTWDEGGIVPALVVEVASGSTSGQDATGKRATYEQMGVREYWRFDPTGKWIAQGLVGWRLADSGYKRVREEAEVGRYRSEVLGLDLRAEGWLLRFRDPILRRDLLTYSESGRALQQTSRALQDAQRERDEAERRAETEAESRLQAERERDEANRRIQELEARLRLSS